MKTLIKKEIRLLLPAWIIAMLLAVVPGVLNIAGAAWAPFNPNGFGRPVSLFFVQLMFAVGVLLLGINSFGQELSCNTFSALLSQPMKRPRVWLIKVATLAAAFLSVWLTAIFFASLQIGLLNQLPPYYGRQTFSATFEFLTLSALVTFSGGLWTTLLLRQITGAFWFTLLTPLAIVMGIGTIFQDWLDQGKSIEIYVAAALVVYSVAGFLLAWRLFMRAQDVQWTGGEISLPRREDISSIRIGSLAVRPGGRFSALAWKELQLHQGALLIAGIVLALHLTAFFIRKFHPHIQNPDLEFVLEEIWLLWLLMPLLIGATAIAEERRMGTLEPQLCLPVSRGAQLLIKFCIALVLSLVFGALVPVLIEGTKALNEWPWIFAVAAALFVISFYTSSLSRTALQGIGWAILLSLAIHMNEAWAHVSLLRSQDFFYRDPQFGVELVSRCVGPILLVFVLGWLTYLNFRHAHQNRKFWLRNILAIVAVFVCVPILARAIYHRTWEMLLPLEPRGPVRITSPSQVKFATTSGNIYSISPDGRLWSATLAYNQVPNGSESMFYANSPILAPGRSHGQFIGDSNWVAVAASDFEALGIRSDGTLWSLPTAWSPFLPQATHSSIVTQIGTNNDWTQVAGGREGFLILKKDGSLWKWGTYMPNWSRGSVSPLPKKLKHDLASLPTRVGEETDWTNVFSGDFMAAARNSRGDTRLFFAYPFLDPDTINQSSSLQYAPGGILEVKTNGELWYFSEAEVVEGYHHRITVGRRSGQQVAGKWKWRSATMAPLAGIPYVMAIRDDGTLWKIFLDWRYPYQFNLPRFVRLGHRSDWIALGTGFALASDGSIWAWNQPSRHDWLAPSRGPAYMGNIFESHSD